MSSDVFQIRVDEPARPSKWVQVKSGVEYVLGRDVNSCSIVVADSSVSRRHLKLSWREQQLLAEDLGSKSGSFSADGVRFNKPMLISSGTELFVGRVRIFAVRADDSSKEKLLGSMVSEGVRQSIPRASVSKSRDESGSGREASALYRSLESAYNLSKTQMRQVHRQLLERLDLRHGQSLQDDQEAFSTQVRETLVDIVNSLEPPLSSQEARDQLVKLVFDEALGLGPLEDLLADETVTEVMVVDSQHVYAERKGKIERQPTFFTSDDAIKGIIDRVVAPLGRRIDEAQPMVDARLKDGSRVNAIIPPLALRGPCITIRKFAKQWLQLDDLLSTGALTNEMARFLELAVRCRKNIVVSGGTGSGKTTLLNILSASIRRDERIVTIEDAAELRLRQEHVVSLEARPANLEGKGAVSIRDLVKNALRMRPDRIVVGECRSGEAIDMLQAMNTGHDGSLTTLHANSPQEATSRLETLVLMHAATALTLSSVRRQIADAIHLFVQVTRYEDGSRRISHISEVVGLDEREQIEVFDLFRFEPERVTQGQVSGRFVRSGYIPRCYGEFVAQGLVAEGEFL